MTDAQTEARAIAHKLQDVVDGTDGWLNIDKATDIIAYTLAVLNDECQQSMREIARERDRAERAEAELAEVRVHLATAKHSIRQHQAQLAAYRQSAVLPDVYEKFKTELAEARKALAGIEKFYHNYEYVLGTARRALDGG